MARVACLPLAPGGWWLTSGWRTPHRPNHQGVDLGCAVGTPLYASMGGYVTTGHQAGGAGNWLNIDNGSELHASFHLSRFVVIRGQARAGDLVGYTGGAKGAPGAGSSTGPHLHFEIRVNGRDIDPWPLIQDADAHNRFAGFVPPPEPTQEDIMTDEDRKWISDALTHQRLIEEATIGTWLRQVEDRVQTHIETQTFVGLGKAADAIRGDLGRLHDDIRSVLQKVSE